MTKPFLSEEIITTNKQFLEIIEKNIFLKNYIMPTSNNFGTEHSSSEDIILSRTPRNAGFYFTLVQIFLVDFFWFLMISADNDELTKGNYNDIHICKVKF